MKFVMMKNRVAVYGSLRVGEYNYNYFKSTFPEIEHTGTHTISGYKLFSLGSYPAATLGNGELVIDTFLVGDDCFASMNGMEIGAGYHKAEVVVDGETHIIWLMDADNSWLNGEREVERGDWSKFIKEREAKRREVKIDS
jgi:gamma-glutamylcyclotransferase (GGCT)/AIG2-like uncharacterized protein YtfP